MMMFVFFFFFISVCPSAILAASKKELILNKPLEKKTSFDNNLLYNNFTQAPFVNLLWAHGNLIIGLNNLWAIDYL